CRFTTSFVGAEVFLWIKVLVPLSVRLLLTALILGVKSAGGSINRGLLRKSGTAGMKLIGNPAKLVSLPTSVGFATSARAKCAFVVLREFAGLTAAEPGRHLGKRQATAVNVSESTLVGQTMSIAIFHSLTLCFAVFTCSDGP